MAENKVPKGHSQHLNEQSFTIFSKPGTPNICPECIGHAGIPCFYVSNYAGANKDQTMLSLPEGTPDKVVQAAQAFMSSPSAEALTFGGEHRDHPAPPHLHKKAVCESWLAFNAQLAAIPAPPADGGIDPYAKIRRRIQAKVAMMLKMAANIGGLE